MKKDIRRLIEASDSVEEVLNSIDKPDQPAPDTTTSSSDCDDPVACLQAAHDNLRKVAAFCNSNDDTFQDKKIGNDANALAHTIDKMKVRLSKEISPSDEVIEEEDLSADSANDGDDEFDGAEASEEEPKGYRPVRRNSEEDDY